MAKLDPPDSPYDKSEAMPSKQELARLNSTALAVLCQKIADVPSSYTKAVADEALTLKKEWVSLQGPPRSTLKEQQQVESKQDALKTRMAEFLAEIL